MEWWRRNLDARWIAFDRRWSREPAKAQAQTLCEDVARVCADPEVRAVISVTHMQPSRRALGEYADPGRTVERRVSQRGGGSDFGA